MEKKLLRESGGVLSQPKLNESEGDKGWTAQVWRLDEVNLNGRIYSTELAQRLVKDNKSTLAYDGHDAEYASGAQYSIAKAVCKEPWIENGGLFVHISFIDKTFEEQLKALMSEGVAIGVSSAGYGEVDESGMVVPESYELVRYLDFVTCPAGEVYAKYGEEAKNGRTEKEMSESEKHPTVDCTKLADGLVNILLRRKK